MSQINLQRQMAESQGYRDKMDSLSRMDEDYKDVKLFHLNDAQKVSETMDQFDPIDRQAEYSSLSKMRKLKLHNEHKERKKVNTFVTEGEFNSTYVQHIRRKEVKGMLGVNQEQLFNAVTHGDYTHMQQLDTVLQNRAATQYMMSDKVRQMLSGGTVEAMLNAIKNEHPEDPTIGMMNPLLRMGISCMMSAPDVPAETKEKFRKLDAALNNEIMIATICKQRGQNPENDRMITKDADWERNFQSQKFMFKMMFACQLGKLKKISSKGTPPSSDWDGPVSNAFAHCSRVMLTLPGDAAGTYDSQAQEKMFRSFHRPAGFDPRAGATHSMSRKRKVNGKEKEIKFFSPRSQYGMNVAVGGLGNGGIPDSDGTKRLLKNDGSCGHLFMHFEEGTKDKHAGMLLGFESDAYGVTNQTGHTHDKKATGEFASSFGGQRCDEIGDKYGGRTADLTWMTPAVFSELMDLADKAFTMVMNNQSANDALTAESLTRNICGGLMDKASLVEFIQSLYSVMGETKDEVTIGNKLAGRDGG